jgi:hypothetical protein
MKAAVPNNLMDKPRIENKHHTLNNNHFNNHFNKIKIKWNKDYKLDIIFAVCNVHTISPVVHHSYCLRIELAFIANAPVKLVVAFLSTTAQKHLPTNRIVW